MLRSTVDRFNGFVMKRRDEDFGRFEAASSDPPPRIETPPFYAAPFFPITRKSMGGIRVDRQTRVLNALAIPMTNLFAAGEVAGFAGINGKAALEGTFLGPSMYMGRLAGREAAMQRESRREPAALRDLPPALAPGSFDNQQCFSCHDVRTDVTRNRAAFWHFEQSHAKVMERRYTCAQCHSDLAPYDARRHRLNRAAVINQCVTCHGVQQRSGAQALD